MGIPPAEERSVSLKAIGVDDIFGCGIRPQQMLQLAEMEAAQEDKLVVILSDVQLDKPLVWVFLTVCLFRCNLLIIYACNLKRSFLHGLMYNFNSHFVVSYRCSRNFKASSRASRTTAASLCIS